MPSSSEPGCGGFNASRGLLVTSANSSCSLGGPASPRFRLIVNDLVSPSPLSSDVRDSTSAVVVDHQQFDIAIAEIANEAADIAVAAQVSGADIEARRRASLIAKAGEEADGGALRGRDGVIADRRLESVDALEFVIEYREWCCCRP